MPEETPKTYVIGVMQTSLAGKPDDHLSSIIEKAVSEVEAELSRRQVNLRIKLFHFQGPHIVPRGGTYAALEFLQIAIVEKVERRLHFLLVITNVDISAQRQSYVLALPSELTNIGVLSTRRLNPTFWGDPADSQIVTERLTALMLHTLGHLLGLPHDSDEDNVMHDFESVEDLQPMQLFRDEQIAAMKRNLPMETRERYTQRGTWHIVLRWILSNGRAVWRGVMRANPIDLAFKLPTMWTAAISLIIVLFFTAEIWDVASTVSVYELGLFSFTALVIATSVLHRAYGLRIGRTRNKALAESTVVTQATTVLSLLLTLIVFYVALFIITYLGIVVIFPHKLMETWPTVDPATRIIDHIKLSLFLSTMGTLGGSLGGRAEDKSFIRHILFLDEET
jgi:predicted Zn-dependent protease